VSDTTTAVPYGVVVSRWFDRRRGLALALMQAGMGAGAVVIPLVVQLLIAAFGWRPAFMIMGGAILIIPMPIVGLFLKETPGQIGLSPKLPSRAEPEGATEGLTWHEIRKSRTYWLMIAAFVLAVLSTQSCTVHLAALLTDRGVSAASAAFAVSVAGLAQLAGRAGTGFLLDRYFGPRVALLLFTAAAFGMGLLWIGATGVPALLAAFLVGLAFGAEIDIMAYLIGRYFGLRALGTAFGFGFGTFVLAAGLGPLLMGYAFDHTGSYRVPLAGFFVATLLAAGLMGGLGPYRFAEERKSEPGLAGLVIRRTTPTGDGRT